MISGDPDIKRGIVKRMHSGRNQPKGPYPGVTKDPVGDSPSTVPKFKRLEARIKPSENLPPYPDPNRHGQQRGLQATTIVLDG